MNKLFAPARFWTVVVAAGFIASMTLVVTIGCGGEKKDTTSAVVKTTGHSKGKVYVAVTGSSELEAGMGNMGMAIVDLDTKKVEMVNLREAKAPHGIIFDSDTRTAPDTRGRIASEPAKKVYLGNAYGGGVIQVDLATRQVTNTIDAPPGANLVICSMQEGPDGNIYLSSMGDGKVYELDTAAGTITDTGVGGGDTTQNICGIAWSMDGKYAYLSNTMNPNDPKQAGYVAKVEWPSGKLVNKIENVTKPSPSGAPTLHQTEVTPDGKYMYVTDGIDGAVVKIDMDTEKIVKTVPVGKEPHSIVFSGDGKTAYITMRHEPVESESSIFVYDVEKDQVIDRIPGIAAPFSGGLVQGPWDPTE